MTDFETSRAPTQTGLLPGFIDPVNGAQSTFRSLLNALSHPGTVTPLHGAAVQTSVPSGLSLAMTALLLTLVDSDTPLYMPSLTSGTTNATDAKNATDATEATRAFLRFHCGCPFVETPADARFVVVPAGFSVPALAACNQGDPAFPDRSSTLLIEVEALHSPSAEDIRNGEPAFVLSGPGIETTQALAVHGLPDDFLLQWRDNHQHFPLGMDVFFTCDTAVCGLPRTTRLEY